MIVVFFGVFIVGFKADFDFLSVHFVKTKEFPNLSVQMFNIICLFDIVGVLSMYFFRKFESNCILGLL